MFESIKYQRNAQRFVNYITRLQKALDSGDKNLILKLSEDAIKLGKRALELSEVVEGIPAEATNALQRALSGVEELYKTLQQKGSEPVEQDPLRQAVKRQYVQLGSQMRVAGGGRAEDFIADRMVDMYRIAADRLDSSPQVLKMIYVDNDTAPKPLREVMSQYLDGKLTKDETAKRLAELKAKTEQYVRDLGTKPENAQRPAVIYQGTPDLEGKLRSDIIADSMGDDGSVDQRQLFMNTAEIFLYDRWAGLAKSLGGRQPTADELIAAQIEAYKVTHKSNPSLGFKDGKEFQTWLSTFERTVRGKGSEYLQVALPAYRAVAEKLAK